MNYFLFIFASYTFLRDRHLKTYNLSNYVYENRLLLIGGVLSIILVSLATIAPIYLFKRIIGLFQRVSNSDNELESFIKVYQEEFVWLMVLAVMVVIIMVVFTFLQNYLMGLFGKKVLFTLRNDIYKRVLDLPISYSHYERKRNTMSLMNSDLLVVERFTVDKIINLIKEPLIIIGSIFTMAYMSVLLTITVFLLAPILFYSVHKISGLVKRVEADIRDDFSYLISLISETLRNLKLIKMFASEDKERDKFSSANRRFFKQEKKLIFYESLNRPSIELIGAICLIIILAVGGYELINNRLSIDRFIAFIVALFTLSNPIRELSRVVILIKQTLVALRRILDFLVDADYNKKPSIIAKYTFKSIKNGIYFDNVSFAFNGGPLVLNNISIKIPKGRHTAIVGESGVGKSSITSLLTLLYCANKGNIYFDDININDFDPVSLRKRISIVPQEDFLFHASIKDNILYAKPDAKNIDVVESAKLANAYDFIMAFPNGFNTIIGEGGINLSGGEKQRISLARAIIRKPELLILDEATKSLDSYSQKMIQNTITTTMKNQTTLIITHQFSNIVHAEQIIVLKDAKVIELGNHDKLVKANGEYQKLYEIQQY